MELIYGWNDQLDLVYPHYFWIMCIEMWNLLTSFMYSSTEIAMGNVFACMKEV